MTMMNRCNSYHSHRFSCDIRSESLSTSESADNSRTRCPDLSRPMKSFSINYIPTSALNEQTRFASSNCNSIYHTTDRENVSFHSFHK